MNKGIFWQRWLYIETLTGNFLSKYQMRCIRWNAYIETQGFTKVFQDNRGPGRGCIQFTGQNNYNALKRESKLNFDYDAIATHPYYDALAVVWWLLHNRINFKNDELDICIAIRGSKEKGLERYNDILELRKRIDLDNWR